MPNQWWERPAPITTAILAQLFSDLQATLHEGKPYPVSCKGVFPEDVRKTMIEITQYDTTWILQVVVDRVNCIRIDCSHPNMSFSTLERLLEEKGFVKIA